MIALKFDLEVHLFVGQWLFYLPFLHLDDEAIGQPVGIKGEQSNSERVP